MRGVAETGELHDELGSYAPAEGPRVVCFVINTSPRFTKIKVSVGTGHKTTTTQRGSGWIVDSVVVAYHMSLELFKTTRRGATRTPACAKRYHIETLHNVRTPLASEADGRLDATHSSSTRTQPVKQRNTPCRVPPGRPLMHFTYSAQHNYPGKRNHSRARPRGVNNAQNDVNACPYTSGPLSELPGAGQTSKAHCME